MQYLMTISY